MLLISFAIPAITLEHRQEIFTQPGKEIPKPSYSKDASAEKDYINSGNETSLAINWWQDLTYLYYLILGLLFIRALYLFGYVRYHLNKNKINTEGNVISVNENSRIKNCSFFNKIIVDYSLPKAQQQLVIQHESIHVMQWHAMDKLLVNLAVSILWFNPFIYRWRNALDHVHEYLADEATTEVYDKKQYASLLLNLATPLNGFAINSFSKLPLKSRISMLYKKPHADVKKLVYLIIIPLVFLCCTAFVNQKDVLIYKTVSPPVNIKPQQALRTEPLNTINNQRKRISKTQPVENNVSPALNLENQAEAEKIIVDQELVLVVDAGHGGKDEATESPSGIKEKDLNLRAAKILKEEAAKRNIKVLLTRDKDEYVALKDRLPDENATAFISIHHNSTPNPMVKVPFNGIEVLVSQSNPEIKAVEIFGVNVIHALNRLHGVEVNGSLRNANLMLLRESKIPAIMIELGNMQDENSLAYTNDEKNLRRISNLILDGFVKFSKS
ncbi:N-acetylmuramoyl-L-alanine amidase [Pedobacter nototheniae]|uniref:N-acetylmuramoyl-L-alanine amidase n=1 Tax=Pedobacter nototheniae TaxID=2488994 RepID=UPI00292FDE8A|nr:N-acetylmuramoyl-L-alanine amidase [Pedobacter nototheniae]